MLSPFFSLFFNNNKILSLQNHNTASARVCGGVRFSVSVYKPFGYCPRNFVLIQVINIATHLY